MTNVIPSTILDTNTPSALLSRAFNVLSAVEELVPFGLPGCSLVLLGTKQAG